MTRRSYVLVAVVAMLAGCTGARATTMSPPDTTRAAPPTSIGSGNTDPERGCTIALEGAMSGTIHAADGPATAGSDFWLSATERASAGSVGQIIVNCTDKSGSVSLAAEVGTTDTQVPFGPGRYGIGGNSRLGPMMVVAVIANQPYVARTGAVDITRFDMSSVEGTMELELVASNSGATVHAHGHFVLGCQGLTQCHP
jgi:hypothetical protein